MPNSIKSKLKNLEERLQAENHDRDNLDMYEQSLTASRGEPANGERAIAAPPMGGMRQTPTLPMGNSNGGSITGRTRSRPIMNLPVPSGHPAATETDTDKKLRKIMKQTGILTVDGHPYKTDIKDLEHLGDLGSGTSGNVVKMRHKPSGTVIAVKQMRRTGNTEENKRILMDLDVVLKSHDCDYIVQCLGCFVHDPDVWICMELMSMCFDKLLKLSKQPVPEPILGKVTVATVKALWYLKDMHGVIHRDVKPSNILIDERGKIKLCDFGISGRLVDSKANTRSAGCAAYMAPERIDPKKPKYDIRADVWSLGITLVELATARSPYEGCKTDFEVLTKVLDSEPPSLPHGDGFHFSQEFREFVNKCLTKNPQMRPKYPELLEQPFIRRYENTDVDVPTWFQHIRTQHSHALRPRCIHVKQLGGSGGMPPLTPAITTMTTKFHRSSIKQSTTTTSNTSTAPPLTSMPGATQQPQQHMTALITTINPPKPLATHIPSYQQQAQQSTNLQQQQQLPQRYHGSKEMARGHLPEMHQPSQLPQPIGGGNYQHHQAKERENGHTRLYSGGVGGGGGGGGSGSSSSATSLSPQSPPSVTTTTQSELSRLYRKSPFTQRKYGGGSFKYNNSGTGNGTAGGAESPKKESVLSSIGQSIIRNLTTSPFAQKKHSHNMQPSNPQPNQVEPLWRMPSGSQDLDFADGAVAPTKIKTFGMDSPFAARKRYTGAENDGAATGPLTSRQEQQQSLPLNRNDNNSASPRIVQGNQSPIVLQRFYHQQQQLREKELEKERLQQHQHQILYPQTTTNPFLSSYNHSAATTTGHHHHHAQHQHQQSHIPVPSSSSSAIYMASSSSQSTSSQSSTQSTSSQINTYELRRKYENVSPPPMLLPVASASSASSAFDSPSPTKPHSPLTAAPIFGVGSSHLQYQPLPSQQQQQQTQQLYRHTAKLEPASVPLQDMQHHDYLEAAGEGLSKLEKLYGRRASSSQGNSSDSGIGSGGVGVGSAGHGDKDGSTSNAVGGATQMYLPRPGQDKESPTSSSSQKSHFYRSISSSGSANTSPSSLGEPLGPPHPLSKIPCSSDFHEGSGAGPFLRRYANGAMGGSPHLLSGLDRRHRSPDPPPRYNRGQSPLLLRKNLLELSGQPPGVSPMMQRRYVSASPPLPPPRRGSESVPGSPQHFRTRIHYTPEPQRRIYRTIDQ